MRFQNLIILASVNSQVIRLRQKPDLCWSLCENSTPTIGDSICYKNCDDHAINDPNFMFIYDSTKNNIKVGNSNYCVGIKDFATNFYYLKTEALQVITCDSIRAKWSKSSGVLRLHYRDQLLCQKMLDFKNVNKALVQMENCNNLEIHPETKNGLTLAAMPLKCFHSFASGTGLQLGKCGGHTHYVPLGSVIEEIESGKCLAIHKSENFYKKNFYASEPVFLDYCDKHKVLEMDFSTGKIKPRGFQSEKCVYVDSKGFLRVRNCIEYVSGNRDYSPQSDLNAFEGQADTSSLQHAELDGYEDHVMKDTSESSSPVSPDDPITIYSPDSSGDSSPKSPKPGSPKPVASSGSYVSQFSSERYEIPVSPVDKIKPSGRPNKSKSKRRKSGRAKWGSIDKSNTAASSPPGDVEDFKNAGEQFKPKPKPHSLAWIKQMYGFLTKPSTHTNSKPHSPVQHQKPTYQRPASHQVSHVSSSNPSGVIDLSQYILSHRPQTPSSSSKNPNASKPTSGFRPPSNSYPVKKHENAEIIKDLDSLQAEVVKPDDNYVANFINYSQQGWNGDADIVEESNNFQTELSKDDEWISLETSNTMMLN